MLRGLATSRVPWGNMYEFINLTCFCGLVAAAVVLRRPQFRALWVFVLVPVLILLTVSGRWLYTNAAPVMPALQSYWLPIHVSVVSLGSGVFLVAGVASILFLLKMSPLGDARTARARWPASSQRLPDAQTLDRIAYRTTIFAFPVFGFGVIFGAIWAEEAWGRYWGWDPKETVAFIAWVIYAAYLHARSTAGWRDRKAAWINVAGFVAMVFNLFFINLVTVGLHSYAGVGLRLDGHVRTCLRIRRTALRTVSQDFDSRRCRTRTPLADRFSRPEPVHRPGVRRAARTGPPRHHPTDCR